MQTEEYARQEKLFSRGKWLIRIGVWIYVIITVLFTVIHIKNPNLGWFDVFALPYFKEHRTLGLVCWASLILAMRPLSVGYLLLYQIFKDFVKNSKIQEAANSLRNVSNGKLVLYPKFRLFLFSRSLKDFERDCVKLYEARRKQYLKLKHLNQEKAKVKSRIEKVESEQEILERQFAEASLSITSEKEVAKYDRRFREAKTLVAAQSVVKEIQAKAREKEDIESRQDSKIYQLLQALLTDASQNGLCQKAEVLVSEVRKSPYAKQKIDYLKQAISTQRNFNKKVEIERMAEASDG